MSNSNDLVQLLKQLRGMDGESLSREFSLVTFSISPVRVSYHQIRPCGVPLQYGAGQTLYFDEVTLTPHSPHGRFTDPQRAAAALRRELRCSVDDYGVEYDVALENAGTLPQFSGEDARNAFGGELTAHIEGDDEFPVLYFVNPSKAIVRANNIASSRGIYPDFDPHFALTRDGQKDFEERLVRAVLQYMT